MFARIAVFALVLTLAWAVVARAGSAAGPEQAYVVEPGDTLWSIAAERYGGDPRGGVWKIQRRNGLDGAGIRSGQRLMLPP
jgi:nucleoid-associated protein YgaU